MSADADLIRDLMAEATALRVRLAERAERRHKLIEEERKRLRLRFGGRSTFFFSFFGVMVSLPRSTTRHSSTSTPAWRRTSIHTYNRMA